MIETVSPLALVVILRTSLDPGSRSSGIGRLVIGRGAEVGAEDVSIPFCGAPHDFERIGEFRSVESLGDKVHLGHHRTRCPQDLDMCCRGVDRVEFFEQTWIGVDGCRKHAEDLNTDWTDARVKPNPELVALRGGHWVVAVCIGLDRLRAKEVTQEPLEEFPLAAPTIDWRQDRLVAAGSQPYG